MTKHRCRVCFAVLFLASAAVLLAPAFLISGGFLRWLLAAIFGLPGAIAFWLGIESLRRTPTANSMHGVTDGAERDKKRSRFALKNRP